MTPSRLTSQHVRQQQWRQHCDSGDEVGLLTANHGLWASPEEFSITVGGRYLRVKNREFALSNRTIVIWTSKSDREASAKIGKVGSPDVVEN